MTERDQLAERIAKLICFDKAWDYMICRTIANFILNARPEKIDGSDKNIHNVDRDYIYRTHNFALDLWTSNLLKGENK